MQPYKFVDAMQGNALVEDRETGERLGQVEQDMRKEAKPGKPGRYVAIWLAISPGQYWAERKRATVHPTRSQAAEALYVRSRRRG